MDNFLTKDKVKVILQNAPAGSKNGLIIKSLVNKGFILEGFNDKKEEEKSGFKQFTERNDKSLADAGKKIYDTITSGEGSAVKRGFEATATAFNEIPKTAYNAIPEGKFKEGVNKVGEKIGEGFNWLVDKAVDNSSILNSPKFQKWADENPEAYQKLTDALSVASSSGQIAGDIMGANQTAKVTQAGVNVAKSGAEKTINYAKDVATKADDLFKSKPSLTKISNAKEKIIDFFSRDIDGKATTILKETPTSKFDKYIKIAKEAVNDPRKITPFGVVGDKTVEATKQLLKQIKSLSQQKKSIISKAKNGLVDFTKETGGIILEIRRALPNSPVAKNIIAKLKKIKTKLDADKLVDDIQDTLYKGNKDMTIPVGSAEDKLLKGILGKYNGQIKQGLPSSYSSLNTKIASRMKGVNSLNKALGEVVDGVSTRGAGLIKQFFSPNGRKAQELFDYIKKTTGIDLAQDATLAKFTMEIFEDARVNALLEGVPISTSGIINTGVQAVIKATGVGKKLKKTLDDSVISKARDLTVK